MMPIMRTGCRSHAQIVLMACHFLRFALFIFLGRILREKAAAQVAPPFSVAQPAPAPNSPSLALHHRLHFICPISIYSSIFCSMGTTPSVFGGY